MFSALESGWSFKKGKPDSGTGALHARKRSCFVKRVGKHARCFDVLSGDGFYAEKTLLAIEAHALFALQNPTFKLSYENRAFSLQTGSQNERFSGMVSFVEIIHGNGSIVVIFRQD